MPALSAQIVRNLAALTTTNEELDASQQRLSSGKKVTSALDGAAIFFRAQNLSERASGYDQVNTNISAALKNVQVANKAMDTMYDNLNGLLQTLRDARAKPVAAAAAISATSLDTYTGGSIVDTTSNFADSSKFQVGDVFAISFT
ncbi:MAG: flagellin, partial [Saprospiraceae bacterium]